MQKYLKITFNGWTRYHTREPYENAYSIYIAPLDRVLYIDEQGLFLKHVTDKKGKSVKLSKKELDSFSARFVTEIAPEDR